MLAVPESTTMDLACTLNHSLRWDRRAGWQPTLRIVGLSSALVPSALPVPRLGTRAEPAVARRSEWLAAPRPKTRHGQKLVQFLGQFPFIEQAVLIFVGFREVFARRGNQARLGQLAGLACFIHKSAGQESSRPAARHWEAARPGQQLVEALRDGLLVQLSLLVLVQGLEQGLGAGRQFGLRQFAVLVLVRRIQDGPDPEHAGAETPAARSERGLREEFI